MHPIYKLNNSNLLGHGTYGEIFACEENENLAIKIFKGSRAKELMEKELHILQKLHETTEAVACNIIDFFGRACCSYKQSLVHGIVLEKASMDLSSYLQQGCLSLDQIKIVGQCVATALAFLERQHVIHSDLKPQNILIVSQGTEAETIVLADFGLATRVEDVTESRKVFQSLWYRSPEVLTQRDITTAIDIWSAGILFIELYRGNPFFYCRDEDEGSLQALHESFLEQKYPTSWSLRNRSPTAVSIPSIDPLEKYVCSEPREHAETPLLDLVTKSLIFEPKQRISAKEMLKHSFLS